MGTWGPGNLECDGALDEVAERSDALVKQLWTRVQNSESWEADEWEHDALFVDFETLLALEAGGVFNGHALTKLERIDQVLDTWLAGWDAYFDGLDPKGDFKAERRAVIEHTFERFKAICDKYRKDS